MEYRNVSVTRVLVILVEAEQRVDAIADLGNIVALKQQFRHLCCTTEGR